MYKLAINNTKKICVKCLKHKKDVKSYKLPMRGYGSDFDMMETKFQFCDECKPNNLENILNEENKNDTDDEKNYCEEYLLEKELHEIIKSLPVEGRELVLNRWSLGATAEEFEPDDFILIETNQASYDLYKKYGLYSPAEIKAYNERYPKCNFVYNVIYSDNSKCSRCINNAYGKFNQSCNSNISSQCYHCSDFKERETHIKTYTDADIKERKQKIKDIIHKLEMNMFKE